MRYIITLVFLLSALLFFSVNISPEALPYAGLISLLIPFFLITNFILFFFLLLRKSKSALLPLVAIILGWKFIGITFQLNSKSENTDGISLLSYNVHMFNYEKFKANDPNISPNIYNWIREQNVDIMGFQEFFQDHTTPSRNAIKLISNEGKYHYSTQIVEGKPDKIFFGLAIFSKHPIINEGKIFDNQRSNGAMFVDLKVNQDTIRVYNAHLESMSIPAEKLDNMDGIKEKYRETLHKLNKGAVSRATQVQVLADHIQNCPYPVILMGDFNDVPYSFTYFTLKSVLKNAFEEVGRGFGFTYNRVLFFLRIDNIFYGKGLTPVQFNTLREVDYSDHYPISSIFQLRKPNNQPQSLAE
ncbi:endonuclease/exonuclease/phosphatase family protein [Echinicola jeungdonensis]|uniref:Endonuclease/exonuclease/phosphatase family protein n=1 Tax=Echinicola jeungdonensis TaxID=709343 RepID=A0ABV5J4M3_9BACT|nr:endonuclease/exonuclease/phosphatase family protein [Echinicola jeungdonensis]MDN3668142.1 endonuclease/exonuclease/phosphatase family protein [Echinicola jeungdonensis]